jgi:hypothetical protein
MRAGRETEPAAMRVPAGCMRLNPHLALKVLATTCRMSVTVSIPFHSLPAEEAEHKLGQALQNMHGLPAGQHAWAVARPHKQSPHAAWHDIRPAGLRPRSGTHLQVS